MSLTLNPIDNDSILTIPNHQLFLQAQQDNLIPPDYKYNTNFTKQEIIDLSTYRPIVSYNTYIYYRNLPDTILLTLEPLLSILINNLKPYDILLYYTRGYMPLDPTITQKLQKCKKYKLLPSPLQLLLNKLYNINTLKDYANSPQHPLEPIIYAFSETYNDTPLTRLVANRYGFGWTSKQQDASVAFYTNLYNYIQKYKNSISNSNYPTTDLYTLLNSSPSEYQKYNHTNNSFETRLSHTT